MFAASEYLVGFGLLKYRPGNSGRAGPIGHRPRVSTKANSLTLLHVLIACYTATT